MDLVEQVELDSSIDEQEARVVPSRYAGTTVIDHIDTYGIPKENVLCPGQFNAVLGPNLIIGVFMPTLTLSQPWDLKPIHKNRGRDVD